jgi:hypothetical protein
MIYENQPATKKDIAGLESKLDAKIDARFGSLDAKIDATTERLDRKIDRVAVEVVRAQADIQEIKGTMATKTDVDRARIDAAQPADPIRASPARLRRPARCPPDSGPSPSPRRG